MIGCGKSGNVTEEDNATSCDLNLPAPALVFTGTEDYTAGGVEYTRYKLAVSNSDSFPNEIFAAAPDLPPCGNNTNSSRTWVDIFDNANNRLYGFCALGSSDDLNSIWFSLPKGTAPPLSVHIVLTDRACETEYTSNSVTAFDLFIGNWSNEDAATDGITRINITLNGLNLDAQEWGSCTPDDCDWGIESTPANDAFDNSLSLFWNQSFVERTQTLELITTGRMKVTTSSHFIDGSGRPDYTTVYYFVK
jgi:hypothetical protein